VSVSLEFEWSYFSENYQFKQGKWIRNSICEVIREIMEFLLPKTEKDRGNPMVISQFEIDFRQIRAVFTQVGVYLCNEGMRLMDRRTNLLVSK
jgi:hypothetical protein